MTLHITEVTNVLGSVNQNVDADNKSVLDSQGSDMLHQERLSARELGSASCVP